MEKEELMDCIDTAYTYGKKLLAMWSDYSMQHIRLRSANEKRIEDNKQRHIEEMDERKLKRYQIQKQLNYERWKKTPEGKQHEQH